jgi:uncharacterized Zn finger protein (UPF0148 family)
VLALQEMVTGAYDGRYVCPACGERVLLPENRQCPSCQVFVDKVDEAWLLKRKIMQQERAKLEFQAQRDASEAEKKTKQSLEAALREKIREELEAEFGMKNGSTSVFAGKKGLLRLGSLAALLGMAFVGGQSMSANGLPWASKGAKAAVSQEAANANVDKMLASGLGAPSADMPPTGAGSNTGDPDIDNDPMIQAIGGKRIGAKGISMEQAISAATVLAKSVGNTTAERALAGNSASGNSGPAGDSATGSAPVTDVPPRLKLSLASELAAELAELGQSRRAEAVLKNILSNPKWANDPQAAAQLRMARLEVRAWTLGNLPQSKARSAADELRTELESIADPAERTLALSRIGVILSQQEQLPPEVAHAFLTLSASALKATPQAQRGGGLVGEWMVSMGQVLVSEATVHAKSGRWSKAEQASTALEALTQQGADDMAQAKLLALNYRSKLLMGQDEKAIQSLGAALTIAAKMRSLEDRGTALKGIAQLGKAASQGSVQTAVSTLAGQLDPANGPEKANALVQLALLHSQAGAQAQADRLSRMAEKSTGLTPTELLEIKADLIVRTDLALARWTHNGGDYAKAETLLKRVGDYLF